MLGTSGGATTKRNLTTTRLLLLSLSQLRLLLTHRTTPRELAHFSNFRIPSLFNLVRRTERDERGIGELDDLVAFPSARIPTTLILSSFPSKTLALFVLASSLKGVRRIFLSSSRAGVSRLSNEKKETRKSKIKDDE